MTDGNELARPSNERIRIKMFTNDPCVDWIDAAVRARRKRQGGERCGHELWWQRWLKRAWDAVGAWPDLPTYGYRVDGFHPRRKVLTFGGMRLEGPRGKGVDFIVHGAEKPEVIVEAKLNNTPKRRQARRYEKQHFLPITFLLSCGNANEGHLVELYRSSARQIILFEDFLKYVFSMHETQYGDVRKELTDLLVTLEPDLKRLALRPGMSDWVGRADMTDPETYYRCLNDFGLHRIHARPL